MFEIAKNTDGTYATTPTTLVSFNGTDGADPQAGLIADTAGNLYGTTAYGGANNDGTIFELVKNADGTYATTPTVLHAFGPSDGENREASLLLAASGTLYGTTSSGGTVRNQRYGTVFALTSQANQPTAIVTATTPTDLAQKGTATVGGPIEITGTPTVTGTGEIGGGAATTGTTGPAAPAPAPMPVPMPAPAPVAPDAVSINQAVTYGRGVFTLTGHASSAAGISAIGISAVLDDGTRQDLGAATVDGDGSFTFTDVIGADQQSFITATETDGAGVRTASADPCFSLTGGLDPGAVPGAPDHLLGREHGGGGGVAGDVARGH